MDVKTDHRGSKWTSTAPRDIAQPSINDLLTRIERASGGILRRESWDAMRTAAKHWRRDMESAGLLPDGFPAIAIDPDDRDPSCVSVRFVRNALVDGRLTWRLFTANEVQAMLDDWTRPLAPAR